MHRTSTCGQRADHWVKLFDRTSIRYGSLLPERLEFPFRESMTIILTNEAIFLLVCFSRHFFFFFFEVSLDSHAIVRNTTETHTPFGNTMQNDGTISQPG